MIADAKRVCDNLVRTYSIAAPCMPLPRRSSRIRAIWLASPYLRPHTQVTRPCLLPRLQVPLLLPAPPLLLVPSSLTRKPSSCPSIPPSLHRHNHTTPPCTLRPPALDTLPRPTTTLHLLKVPRRTIPLPHSLPPLQALLPPMPPPHLRPRHRPRHQRLRLRPHRPLLRSQQCRQVRLLRHLLSRQTLALSRRSALRLVMLRPVVIKERGRKRRLIG